MALFLQEGSNCHSKCSTTSLMDQLPVWYCFCQKNRQEDMLTWNLITYALSVSQCCWSLHPMTSKERPETGGASNVQCLELCGKQCFFPVAKLMFLCSTKWHFNVYSRKKKAYNLPSACINQNQKRGS